MNAEAVQQFLPTIPDLCDYRFEELEITRLPGLTNLNYRVRIDRHDWVLRLPKAATAEFIDRDAEAHNQAIAADLGIAPRASWRDSRGVSLTPTLTSTRPLNAADFDSDQNLETILAPIRRLHHSDLVFRGRVEPGQSLQQYFSLLDGSAQARFRERWLDAQQRLAKLEGQDDARVASHNDLVLENLMLAPQQLWIIDWEFSAMASPYWDLATLCNAAGLDDRQGRQLLQIYCADSALMEESILSDYRILLQLLSDCWMAALLRN